MTNRNRWTRWRNALRVCLVSVVFLGFFQSAFALSQNRWLGFVVSAKAKQLPVQYVIGGLKHVGEVYFERGAVNSFHPLLNYIVFDDNIGDSAARLRTVDHMGSLSAGTVYHEVFHAFFYHIIQKQRGNLYARFGRQVDKIYDNIPFQIALKAHEEAWASYIGDVVASYLYIQAQIHKIVEDGRWSEQAARRMKSLRTIWEKVIHQSVAGYYSPADSVSLYWRDVFGGVSVLVREGYGSYRRYQDRDKTIYLENVLTDEDRYLIQKNIFEGRISPDFEQTFLESASIAALSGQRLSKAE